MTQNPLYNALLAAGYIALVVLIIHYGVAAIDAEENILIPIIMLSLFVLSAATMGYLFLYQPAMLYLAGRQSEGVNLFLKTLGFFAAITVVLLIAFFFSSAL